MLKPTNFWQETPTHGMSCIYCKQPAGNSSQSHILPASLGGGAWACLRDGIVCSACNQYFGDKVEKQALGSFPFSLARIFFGIPTRKNKAPFIETHLGKVSAGNRPGTIGMDPKSNDIENAINQNKISQLRILAEVTEPTALARLLLKMGLETVAQDKHEAALSKQFDDARTFARFPRNGQTWWLLLAIDHQRLFARFQSGIIAQEWIDGISLSTTMVEDAELFRFQFLDIVLLTPLERRIMPPSMEDFPEPDYRLIQATI